MKRAVIEFLEVTILEVNPCKWYAKGDTTYVTITAEDADFFQVIDHCEQDRDCLFPKSSAIVVWSKKLE